MDTLNIGDFIEIKSQMKINNKTIPIAYGCIQEVNSNKVTIGLYDEKRLFVGSQKIKETDIFTKSKFNRTNKEPAEIALEFRRAMKSP
jgi:hypothetical protein